MFVRNLLVPALLVGAFASVASAVTFTAESRLVVNFGTLPSGVTIDESHKKTTNFQVSGDGVTDQSVKFDGNGVDRFTVESKVSGEAIGDGSVAISAAEGLEKFTFTNTSNVGIDLTIKVKLDQIATISDEDQASAFSLIGPKSDPTSGSFLAVPDSAGNLTESFTDTETVMLHLKKNSSDTYSVEVIAAGAAAPVPEPASLAALGLGAMVVLRRRKK